MFVLLLLFLPVLLAGAWGIGYLVGSRSHQRFLVDQARRVGPTGQARPADPAQDDGPGWEQVPSWVWGAAAVALGFVFFVVLGLGVVGLGLGGPGGPVGPGLFGP